MSISTRAGVLCALMLSSAAGAYYLKPTVHMAGQTTLDLERMVPKQFGDWSYLPDARPILPDREVEARLKEVYDQVLARTYINGSGERVMLSIAYGGDQSRGMQIHKPETCYTSQGFQVKTIGDAVLRFKDTDIRTRQLLATSGPRSEPITYWIRLGDTTVYGGLGQTIRRLQMGFQGVIPDGTLVRVSTIDRDNDRAFQIQRAFSDALLQSVDATARNSLVGAIK
ncbi:EpsI family protein [Chitinimonas arctica]|uniref:EpsI family protein n=1 Tax=Chitinimonas arctica TaxID=2594795 RepID=A0A516SEX5_9NEIS|nr:exosortase-associated protein EpsI, B-type [Chitinimonas arctica]QDQ26670.1 EpsI family protein [Chitinimonas arctica]